MKLEGLHHITMITGDARRNVEFYAETLGLRLVKKTVNFDAPDAYHLYFGDETGAPGSLLTWFEFPGAAPGQPGNGMIHLIELGVRSPEALEFWARRLAGAGYASTAAGDRLAFRDYDGLAFELVVADTANPPLVAVHPEIPAEHALVGIQGARAYGTDRPHAGDFLTDVLGFAALGAGGYRLVGEHRKFGWAYDDPPSQRGRQGAGTVHHIAWASRDEDHLTWRLHALEAGCVVTDVRDRGYFKSIYFREPRGILFEIATVSPGFAVDEEPDHLGEQLKLPTAHEHLRPKLEQALTPIINPRSGHGGSVQN